MGWTDKILFTVNALVAILLVIAYTLPYISTKSFPILAVLSLAFPALVFVNFLFLGFWILKLKKQFLLSLLVLLLGFSKVKSIYLFKDKNTTATNSDISVMSYNVRLFNLHKWISVPEVDKKIKHFVANQKPKIICFQEFLIDSEENYSQYPYRFVQPRIKNGKTGLAIFSDYPIIAKGSLDFPDTGNNVIYADFLKGKDTLRVYNMHLESLKIDPEHQHFDQKNTKRLIQRIGKTFVKQEAQAKLFISHQRQHKYPTIVCGDLNNAAFSQVSRLVRADKQDAFLEAGRGFGKTFNFKGLPIRIDFIFVTDNFLTADFVNFQKNLSDHEPILASLQLR